LKKVSRVVWVVIVVAVSLVVAAGALAVIFLKPDIPYPRLEAKYGNAQSRFMDLPGGLHVHYRDQGNPLGPPIVMVHGYSASLQAWEPWVARLGADYRIVTLDLPGHGLTRAPAAYVMSLDRFAEVIDTVAQRLRLGPYVVVGNSMGGGAAWTLALHHPDHLRALVLVDSIGWPEPSGDKATPFIFKLMATPFGRLILRHIDPRSMAQSGLRSAYVDPALVTPALVDRYVDLARAPGHRAILLNGDNGKGPAVTAETLNGIKLPTLVMHGEADAIVPITVGRALAGAIPGAKLVTYPGVGHVPMEQSPDLSAHDLRAFIQSLPARGA
jgi:pimeloyl-ACP methyl ester carboxylesterase